MLDKSTTRRPGDLFLERYMPDATEAAREEARANLYALLTALVQFEERHALDAGEIRQNDDPGLDSLHRGSAPKL